MSPYTYTLLEYSKLAVTSLSNFGTEKVSWDTDTELSSSLHSERRFPYLFFNFIDNLLFKVYITKEPLFFSSDLNLIV